MSPIFIYDYDIWLILIYDFYVWQLKWDPYEQIPILKKLRPISGECNFSILEVVLSFTADDKMGKECFRGSNKDGTGELYFSDVSEVFVFKKTETTYF